MKARGFVEDLVRVCRFLSRDGVTWRWVRDPEMQPQKL